MKTMKRNPKADAILKNKHASREGSGLTERYSDRQSRHDAHQRLRSGDWRQDDQYEGERLPSAFLPDIAGWEMPQNPQIGNGMEVAL